MQQIGKVTLQNSKHQPLPNVQIRALGAIPTSSDIQGNFKLYFNKTVPGQLLLLNSVYKDGYELVNGQALKQWTVSSTQILPIVMCPKGSLAAAQEKYYEIGRNHNMLRYTNACNLLKQQLSTNKLTIKQYNAELDSLSTVYQQTMKQLESYAYAMACYNRDDLNQLDQKALLLVEQGHIDEALILYRNAHLDLLYNGLDIRNEQLSLEIQKMIPSLQLNKDICLFAGGNENLYKAQNIYESIALSDTTNATYAQEYAHFLSDNCMKMEEANHWLKIAIQHSTDSLQLAELHTEIAMTSTYINNLKESYNHLIKASKIYTEHTKQKEFKEDAYFNMSYAIYCITESRYWLACKRIQNALQILINGVPYANQAYILQPEKFSYAYAFYLQECATITHEFAVSSKQKNAQMLQHILELSNASLQIAKNTDKKERIKAIQLQAGIYNLLGIAYANWGDTKKSKLYADSCNLTIEQNKHLNPVLFEQIQIDNLTLIGEYSILKQDYITAAKYLSNSYQQTKNKPYAARSTMQILHLLTIAAPALKIEDALHYTYLSFDYMNNHPQILTPQKKLDIYWGYVAIRAFTGKELNECEDVLLALLNYIKKNDVNKKWFRDDHMEQLQTILFSLYKTKHKQLNNKKKKKEILQAAIEVIGMYTHLKDCKLNQQVIATLL